MHIHITTYPRSLDNMYHTIKGSFKHIKKYIHVIASDKIRLNRLCTFKIIRLIMYKIIRLAKRYHRIWW